MGFFNAYKYFVRLLEKTFNIRLTMKEMTEINSYKDIINKLKKK